MSKELLREKALLLCSHCTSVGLPVPQFQIVSERAVNFIWRNEVKKHILALYYRSASQHWTLVASTDWVRQVILPLVQPLFEQTQIPESLPSLSSNGEQKRIFASPSPQRYFAEAIACFSLLAPFAQDNIDFSIIYEQTRQAIGAVLNDSAFSDLNQAALQVALDLHNTSTFPEAKEYLTRCLTLCNINNVVN